ncbi:hypothetical protein BD324DRAFT_574695 [Kockovaella imperatae]|uniref:J domain-containing protein n=1 Tax=Kockovaella imperatae TaxID=4999 RepID=A0A1Y1URE5_9TREE|nr:hypothetical protein BD324DRAFT_574695 [Kockovaella imperatae]ORX40529.1 hypothetical protein BD324DRAFT_574695 [Kockovaella imperatae]
MRIGSASTTALVRRIPHLSSRQAPLQPPCNRAFAYRRCLADSTSKPQRACPSCQAHLPVTTTPCSECQKLLPFPSGLSHHSILGERAPFPLPATPFSAVSADLSCVSLSLSSLGLSEPILADSSSSITFDIPAELSTIPSHGYVLDVREARNKMLHRQRELHPDKFASEGEVIVQLARDLSGRVNEAYSVLADPLKRADYILSVHSSATEESDSLDDPMLLAEIMEAREDLENAETKDEVDRLGEENQERIESTIAQITEAFSQQPPDIVGAKGLAVQLRYWRGLEDAIRDWEPGKSQVMIH